MRRTLALLALLPLASALPSQEAPASSFPRGEAVFRPECFGQVLEESIAAPTGAIGTTSTRATSGPPARNAPGNKSPVAKPSPAQAPPPPAAPAEMPADDMDASSPATGSAKGAPTKKAKSESASQGTLDSLGTSQGDLGGGAAPEAEEVAAVLEKDTKEMKSGEDRHVADERDREAQSGPVLDWGATVYLSNDDSMSLASAQRLLYSVMNGIGFSTSQIRPHELLNYFSFDTVTPDADQTFDVLASAEQDGDRLSVALAIKGATPERQSLDLTVLIDRSCSMQDGGRMDYTKRGLDQMSDQLVQGDRVDVVLFDDRTCVPLQNFVVGRDDPSLLQRTIDSLQPEGATDVDLGLREAYKVAKSHLDAHGRNRRMMIVTDALMNTGDVNADTISEIGKAYEADGIRLTGIGVGSEFNDKALNLLTEKGKGAYVFLGSEAVVDRVFGAAGFQSLTQTLAHDVHFALKLPPSLAMERFYGEEASTVREEVQPINYYAGTTQLFLQDLVLKNGRPVASDPVELEIEYRDAQTGEPQKRVFRTTVGKMIGTDPHNVRKGLALMAWTDMLTLESMGGDPCGAELQTYASRASGVADDAEIAFVNGLVKGRCGAFELPAMVSNKGVPFKVKVDADIPISSVALSCGRDRFTESLSASDVIAMFTPRPGVCELTLSGTVDMTAQVEVPSTGGDLRCLVRGGRIHCS